MKIYASIIHIDLDMHQSLGFHALTLSVMWFGKRCTALNKGKKKQNKNRASQRSNESAIIN